MEGKESRWKGRRSEMKEEGKDVRKREVRKHAFFIRRMPV